jgi:hypothetical protein
MIPWFFFVIHGENFLLAERLENLLHQIENLRELQLKRNVEKLRDPLHDEERDETDHEADDEVSNRVNGFLDLIFLTGRENEGNTTENNEEETQNRGKDEAERDESRNDVDDRSILDKITQHKKRGRELRGFVNPEIDALVFHAADDA